MILTSTDYLVGALSKEFGVDVATLVPADRPDFFIRVDASNPVPLSPVHESTLMAVQVYGLNLDQVVDTAGLVRRFLADRVYVGSDHILGWEEQAGPHDFPDPDIPRQHRWQLTGSLYTTST